MRRGLIYQVVVLAALSLAACGPSERAENPPGQTPQVAEAQLDPDPKFIGAPNDEWQTAGDAIRDDTLVRDVTFAAEGRGAMVEVITQPAAANVHVQLINNEGVVLGEADAAAGQEARLTGQATGGTLNMIRITRETRTSAPTPFTVRIRTIPESN